MDREILPFPVQLTTSRIGNLTRLIHTLAIFVAMHVRTGEVYMYIETGKVVIAHGSVEFCEATPIGLADESKEPLYGRETDRDLRNSDLRSA